MKFLTAEWRDLILLNFPVPDDVLLPRLPPGLSLDHYGGHAYVSLVAFNFLRTRVLGVRWPGHADFAEINLRFYVRDGERRGVVFIREFVPQRLTAWAARALYNEPYAAAKITAETEPARKTFKLAWCGAEHRLSVRLGEGHLNPSSSSAEHFFKEHEWGFGVSRRGKRRVYRVEHPVWAVRPIIDVDVSWDFATVYGPEWGFLSGRTPESAVFALGSKVTVFGHSPF